MNMTQENLTAMNVQNTQSEGLKPLFDAVLNRYTLETVKETNVFNQFGQKVKIPKGRTKAITFDRMQPLNVSTVKLEEGVTPAGDELTIDRMTAQPEQYGHYVAFTDEADFYKHDPSPQVLKVNEALAEQAASTFDLLTLGVLSEGTNAQYANARDGIDALTASDVMSVKEVMRAVRTLKANKAKPVSGQDYVCVLDPYMAHDIMLDDRWQNVKEYDPKDMYNGELGKLYGVRFVGTTQDMALKDESGELVTGADGCEIHRAFFFGKDAYGSADVKGNIETVVQPAVDPLHQVSTIGWKGHHTAAILTEEWMVQCYSAVSE